MARRTASSILVLPAITVGASFHKQSSPSSGEHYEQSDPWPQPGGLRPGWVSHLASGAGDRACIRWDQATTRPASAGCPDDGYGSTHRRSGNDIELSNPGLRCLDGQSGGESPIPLLSGCTPPPLGTEARVTTSGTTPETRPTWAPRPGRHRRLLLDHQRPRLQELMAQGDEGIMSSFPGSAIGQLRG
jgi:hypothetical protein